MVRSIIHQHDHLPSMSCSYIRIEGVQSFKEEGTFHPRFLVIRIMKSELLTRQTHKTSRFSRLTDCEKWKLLLASGCCACQYCDTILIFLVPRKSTWYNCCSRCHTKVETKFVAVSYIVIGTWFSNFT